MMVSLGLGLTSIRRAVASEPVDAPVYLGGATDPLELVLDEAMAPVDFSLLFSGTGNSYTSSALPPGLSLHSTTGVLSGTPTEAGTDAVTVTATNAGGSDDTGPFDIVVAAAVAGTGTLVGPIPLLPLTKA